MAKVLVNAAGKVISVTSGGSSSLVGTVIDPAGTLNKLYINATLTPSEMVTEIKKLTDPSTYFFITEGENKMLVISNEEMAENNFCVIGAGTEEQGSMLFYFIIASDLNDPALEDFGITELGIYKTNNPANPFAGCTKLSSAAANITLGVSIVGDGLVGSENNKLTKVFSANNEFTVVPAPGPGMKVLVK